MSGKFPKPECIISTMNICITTAASVHIATYVYIGGYESL